MNPSQFVTLIPYILSAAVSLWVAISAWKRRSVLGASSLASIALLEILWIIGYIFQQIAVGLNAKLFWNNFQFIGAVFAPVAYLSLAIQYNQRSVPTSRTFWKIILPLASGLLLFIWTDGWHHLFRINPQIVSTDVFSILVFQDGPLFPLYTLVAYSVMVISTILFLINFISAPRLYQFQIGVVLVGILFPWVNTILTSLNIVNVTLHDTTPITFGLSNLIIGWALFRYRLFEIIPIARDILVEQMQDGFIVLEKNLLVVDINPAAQQMLNLSANSILGQNLLDFFPEMDGFFKHHTQSGISYTEIQISKTSTVQHIEIQSSNLLDVNHVPKGYLLILRDITLQKIEEVELRKTISLLQATIELTTNAIIVVDSAQNLIICNNNYLDLMGFDSSWRTLPPKERVEAVAEMTEDPQKFLDEVHELTRDLTIKRTSLLRMKDGRIIERETRPYYIGDHLFGRMYSYVDITERINAEQMLRTLAITDPLTKIFNRRHFYTLASQELERSSRYNHPASIIMVDIDHFKNINDTFGHLIGDQMLESIARIFQQNLRKVDILARYGGEEFILLLPETQNEQAFQTAERLRLAIEDFHIPVKEKKAKVTLSLGIACSMPGENLALDKLLERADQALYAAKESGRNRACIYQSTFARD